jgi:hypothetical protein
MLLKSTGRIQTVRTKTPPSAHDSARRLMRSVRGQETAEKVAESGVHVRNQTSQISQRTMNFEMQE